MNLPSPEALALTVAGLVIWRQRRKLRHQADAAIEQALELAAVRDELDDAMADNDRLTVINRGLADDLFIATAEVGRLLDVLDGVWAENARLAVGETS